MIEQPTLQFEPNSHPHLTFKVTGYWNENARLTDAEVDALRERYPLGSEHEHRPASLQVKYLEIWEPESFNHEEERRALGCLLCHPPRKAEDNRKAPGAG